MDFRDWFILASVASVQIVATAYLFWRPTDTAFMTWSGVVATICGSYHWIVVKDSKEHDA